MTKDDAGSVPSPHVKPTPLPSPPLATLVAASINLRGRRVRSSAATVAWPPANAFDCGDAAIAIAALVPTFQSMWRLHHTLPFNPPTQPVVCNACCVLASYECTRALPTRASIYVHNMYNVT